MSLVGLIKGLLGGRKAHARDAESDNYIAVPEPLFKYSGGKIIHDENLSIMELFARRDILPARELKALKRQMEKLERQLAPVDDAKAEYQSLVNEMKALVEMRNGLPAESDALAMLTGKLKKMNQRRLMLKTLIQTRGTAIKLRERIRQQITAHHAAVDDARREVELQKAMAEEAEIVASQITRTLARLGFQYSYTVRNKTKTEMVKFDYVVATPDQLQFKLLASKQGLFGGGVDLLPRGVYVTDIIQPRVLNELSIALEREVWSPHTGEDKITLVNGGWLIMERLGLVEGIPRNVTYRQLMARYETAEHDKLPIPAGLRRGRRINWLNLDSPSGIHLMFTGISGSGKSNAMRAMVSCVVEKQSPDDIRFVFIDLKKQGDFREFADAPHCLAVARQGVLTEISEVVEMLKRVRDEMHARQKTIGVISNNLIDYNKRVNPDEKLPRIVIVFDEYANTRRARYADDADVIDDICIEIGQVGRAAGISLWIGIQQPRRDNMPSSLRDNITTIFVGHQANVGAAQSTTGNRDAMKLEDIPGRMAATVGWKTDKVQMPFITEDDVKGAVNVAIGKYGERDDTREVLREGGTIPEDAPDTPYELVLRTCFEQLNAELKARPIYETLKPRLSQSIVNGIVKRIIEEGAIWHGVEYQAVKQKGNFHALELVIEEDTETDSPLRALASSN